MSMCRVISCAVERGCLLWPVHSLGKTLLAFALFMFMLQGQSCLLLQVSLDFLLLHSSPLWWERHFFFLVLVLEGLIGYHRTVQLLSINSWGIDLDYCDTERFALETNRDIFLSFLRLHRSTAFQTFCWLWGLLHLFQGILAHRSRNNGHLN